MVSMSICVADPDMELLRDRIRGLLCERGRWVEAVTEGRATAKLTALVGARVIGEHGHPALVERFTVLEGELTVKLAGQTTVSVRARGCGRTQRNGKHVTSFALNFAFLPQH